MPRFWQYFKYVIRHKWYVFWACYDYGVPLWMALLHDWDKFLPASFSAYAKTFYNKDGSKRYEEFPEFAVAWNQHQKLNKHHWQWWRLTWDRGDTEALPMPSVYRREMLADWCGAGKALGKPDTRAWYLSQRPILIEKIHPETIAWLDGQLMVHV